MRRASYVLALALSGLAPGTGGHAADFWDDRPLKIVQSGQANFPAVLTAEGVTSGEVRAILHVDAGGKLVDCLVTDYTRRELATELVAAARDWTYEPARQRGEPVPARVKVVFTFQARGSVLTLTPLDTVAVTIDRFVPPELTSLLCRPSDLDEPVRVVHTVEPSNPGTRGTPAAPRPTVLLDFYIDTEGRPRMPVVLKSAGDAYALAALDALLQWRFNPPTRQGRPAIVRATQLFSFSDRNAGM